MSLNENGRPEEAGAAEGADDVGVLVRRAGETFVPAAPGALAEAGILRGRRRLVRRRVTAAVGSALAFTLIAGGAVYGGELLRRDEGVSAAGSPATRLEVSAAQMAKILENALDVNGPYLSKTHVEADGSTGGARPTAKASMTFDDSTGWARVDVAVRRVDPKSDAAKQLLTCPKDDDVESCTPGADNRVLKLRKTDRGVLEWQVALVGRYGYAVEVSEFNARDENEETRRARLPMTVRRLQDVARFVDASFDEVGRVAPTEGWKILASLLPERLEVRRHSENQGNGELWVYDPKTRATTYINAFRIVFPKKEFPEALPNEVRRASRQVKGEKTGVVLREADVWRPFLTQWRISAYNAESPKGRATTAEPALTLEEVKAIAADPAWLVERFERSSEELEERDAYEKKLRDGRAGS
ncbi:hypothetical protein [Streptomyces sp. NPDC050504]|uniref:hypothetical protein n=1 Tax=Streptomyces sp. NPDC050504 TaxID=3365618 RepID=UPI0037AE9885